MPKFASQKSHYPFKKIFAGGSLAVSLVLTQAAPAGALTAGANNPSAAPGFFAETNLAADRTSSNFFYRIPALVNLGNGVVLASWDGRPGSATDAPNPNSIVQRRSTDGGKTWGPIQVIAAGSSSAPKHGYSDPSYVYDEQKGKVFAFFVYSKDRGFFDSQFGNDDADRNVISSAVIESSDQGQTWSKPRFITNITKPGSNKNAPSAGDVRANFATSGEGIQLKYGPNKGRLIQQFAGDIRQADGSMKIQAYSVYSDDHGVTWKKGNNVGEKMDENKTVELSDGRVMMNSRDNAKGGYRKVAISQDGGISFDAPKQELQLPDPGNNAAISRMYPSAAQGSAEAKKLIFTNSNSKTARENVTARVSCDDGATWPGKRVIRPGFSAYSSVTRLENGMFGVLYEANYVDNMQFARFDDAWLNYVCAPLSVNAASGKAGQTLKVPVSITNQETTTISGAKATISVPSGWTSGTVNVPDVAPGNSVTVSVDVSIPAGARGAQQLEAKLTTSQGKVSQYSFALQAS